MAQTKCSGHQHSPARARREPLPGPIQPGNVVRQYDFDPIKVHVKATPNQRFDGAWAMICTKGSRHRQTQRTVSGLTPRVKELRMPFTNPDHCDVAAIARLRNRGGLFVYLTARVPTQPEVPQGSQR